MNRQPLRYLPEHKTPTGTRCILIDIPDDDDWERALYSSIRDLGNWSLWQRDDGKNGKVVAALWRKALATFRYCDNTPSPITGISEMEYEMSVCEQLRFSNGKLQGYCCGEWTDISGQEWMTIGGPSQPSVNAPQPTPGQTACYPAALAASGFFLLPTPVSTGDTLVVSNASGAVSNSHNALWHGPDGSQFFAGAYVGFPQTDGSNPVPTAPTSSLIIKFGSTWYALGVGSFTVPGGVSAEQPVIQVNDDSITGLGGDFGFKICATNNGVGTWTKTFDFSTGPHGWTPFASDNPTVWVASAGWQSTLSEGAYVQTYIRIDPPSGTFNITDVDVFFDRVAGAGTTDPETDGLETATAVFAQNAFPGVGGGTGIHYIWHGTQSLSTLMSYENASYGGTTGSVLIRTITVSGTGTEPIWP